MFHFNNHCCRSNRRLKLEWSRNMIGQLRSNIMFYKSDFISITWPPVRRIADLRFG